jgi:hypothetical protein
MTETPGRARSVQSRIPFGFPDLTRKTIVDVYGDELCGRRACHPGFTRPRSASASTSYARASVTTSALSPSITERACFPDPPCDILTVTAVPVFARYSLEKAAFTSR